MKAISFAFLGVLALLLSSCGSGIGRGATFSSTPPEPTPSSAVLQVQAFSSDQATLLVRGLTAGKVVNVGSNNNLLGGASIHGNLGFSLTNPLVNITGTVTSTSSATTCVDATGKNYCTNGKPTTIIPAITIPIFDYAAALQQYTPTSYTNTLEGSQIVGSATQFATLFPKGSRVWVKGNLSISPQANFEDVTVYVDGTFSATQTLSFKNSVIIAKNADLNTANSSVESSVLIGKDALKWTTPTLSSRGTNTLISSGDLTLSTVLDGSGAADSLRLEALGNIQLSGSGAMPTLKSKVLIWAGKDVTLLGRNAFEGGVLASGAIFSTGTSQLELLKGIAPAEEKGKTAVIGDAGGTLELGDAKLTVPPGALPAGTRVNIEQLDALPAPLPTNDELMFSRIPGAQVVTKYRLSTSVPEFTKTISLILPIDLRPNDPNVRTFLYAFDGTTYDLIRIGKVAQAFEFSPNRLPTSGGQLGFTAGISLVAVRVNISDLTADCVSKGGNFNGSYCELPYLATTSLSTRASGPRPIFILTENVGNGIPSGPQMERDYCTSYLLKLCSRAVEAKIRRSLRMLPSLDIISFQEMWNNDCTEVTRIEDGIVLSHQGVDTADRICVELFPNGSTQISRLIDPITFEFHQSPIRRFASESDPRKRIVNGYEFVALHGGVFEFIQQQNSIQPACTPVSTTNYWLGSDTGMQVERIRPISFQYLDTLTPTDIVRAQNTVTFDIVNAHLAAVNPFDGTLYCQESQLKELAKKYYNTALDRPLLNRILAMGDFNTDGVTAGIGAIDQFFANFSLVGTTVADQVSREGFTGQSQLPKVFSRIAYHITDNSFSAALPVVGFFGQYNLFALDHVLSNFADGSCQRLPRVMGADHVGTLCSLTGFDAGYGSVLTSYITTAIDPSTGNQVNKEINELDLISARRKGVQLSYVRNRAYNNVGLNTFVGLPSNQDVIIEVRRCTINQFRPEYEFSANVQPNGAARQVKVFSSEPQCF